MSFGHNTPHYFRTKLVFYILTSDHQNKSGSLHSDVSSSNQCSVLSSSHRANIFLFPLADRKRICITLLMVWLNRPPKITLMGERAFFSLQCLRDGEHHDREQNGHGSVMVALTDWSLFFCTQAREDRMLGAQKSLQSQISTRETMLNLCGCLFKGKDVQLVFQSEHQKWRWLVVKVPSVLSVWPGSSPDSHKQDKRWLIARVTSGLSVCLRIYQILL